MKPSSYQNWIRSGYEGFAFKGPAGIVVENISAELGVSKSAFYHHFGDQQYFIEMLLDEHLERASGLGKEARYVVSFIPDLPNLILRYKTAILFHRQLRMHHE